MSENPFNITSEDIRKAESKEAKYHGGEIPKDSDVSAMKVIGSQCSFVVNKLTAGL